MFQRLLSALAVFVFVSTAHAVDLGPRLPKATPILAQAPEPASAKPLSCSGFAETTTRPVSFNTGTYMASPHASGAQVADLYCQFSNGFYFDLLGQMPFNGINDGSEVDVRAGWTGKVGGFSIDVSAANYYFRVRDIGGIDHLNARIRIGYAFETGIFSIEPFVLGDTQHSFFVDKNAYATAAGLLAGMQIAKDVRAEVEVAVWQHYAQEGFFASKHPTVWSIQPRVSYKLNPNWTAMVGGLFTQGDVVFPGDHDWKAMGRVRLMYAF